MSNGPNGGEDGPPPHFIVIVPGYMGSILRDRQTGEVVWIDVPELLKKVLLGGRRAVDAFLEKMAYPNPNLVADGIVNEVLVVEPFFKLEQYGRLLEELEQWGYQIEPDDPAPTDSCVYTFPYDWRQDNRISARQLGEAVEGWRQRHPGAEAWLIAHSNGGIVSRWYIQEEGGAEHVGRLYLMGSPWDGAPKAFKVLMDGFEVLGRRWFNRWNLGPRMKEMIRSFPSFYQLLPVVNPYLRTEDNEDLDLFQNRSWLESPDQNQLLDDARLFNEKLAAEPGVDTICFFGTRKPTTTAGIVQMGAGGGLLDIQWIETGAGDGTVPVRSARHPWFEAQSRDRWRAFPVGHGDIYIDGGVLAFLKQELIDQYEGVRRAAIFTPDFSIIFNPERGYCGPGEELSAWAEIKDAEGKPISKATVRAALIFRQKLPGSEDDPAPVASEPVRLRERRDQPGRYEGVVTVPGVEGYYDLQGSIKVPRKPTVMLNELVLVEHEPEPE